jgi:hypothetical protein
VFGLQLALLGRRRLRLALRWAAGGRGDGRSLSQLQLVLWDLGHNRENHVTTTAPAMRVDHGAARRLAAAVAFAIIIVIIPNNLALTAIASTALRIIFFRRSSVRITFFRRLLRGQRNNIIIIIVIIAVIKHCPPLLLLLLLHWHKFSSLRQSLPLFLSRRLLCQFGPKPRQTIQPPHLQTRARSATSAHSLSTTSCLSRCTLLLCQCASTCVASVSRE